MDCKKWFDPSIKKVIDLFSHPVWFVVLDENISCGCITQYADTPRHDCPVCLGTGKKYSLSRVYACNQNAKNMLRGENIGIAEVNIVNVYYTKNKTNIKIGDYIVDHDCLDIVTDVYYERSDDSKVVYWRIETVPKKTYTKEFRAGLKKTLEKAGYPTDEI